MSLRANIGTPTPAWSCRPDTHSIGRTAALSKQTSALDELYGYDGLNRLTSFQRGTITGTWPDLSLSTKVQKRQWLLEALGNWRQFQVNSNYADDEDYTDAGDLDQARTHNKVNEIHNATAGAAITEGTSPQQAAWVDPVHDAAGNMTQAPLAGSSGDLSAGQTRLHLVYDAWNRQVKVYTDDGDGNLEAGGDDAQRLECAYDGLGQRIIKVDKTGQSEVTYHYYYNEAWQVLEERVGDDPDPYAQYAWDARYIDAPVVRWRDTTSPPDGQVDETLYFTNDANMNVTAAVDASSTVQERYTYDAYGTPTFRDGSWNGISWASSRKNEILFCGYRYDPQTGYYHVRYRVYHPDLGRWAQRDPVEYLDRTSLYEAVRSDPISRLDPLGLADKTLICDTLRDLWVDLRREKNRARDRRDDAVRRQVENCAAAEELVTLVKKEADLVARIDYLRRTVSLSSENAVAGRAGVVQGWTDIRSELIWEGGMSGGNAGMERLAGWVGKTALKGTLRVFGWVTSAATVVSVGSNVGHMLELREAASHQEYVAREAVKEFGAQVSALKGVQGRMEKIRPAAEACEAARKDEEEADYELVQKTHRMAKVRQIYDEGRCLECHGIRNGIPYYPQYHPDNPNLDQ